MREASKAVWGKAMLLATAVIWGSGFVVMKGAVDQIPPAYLLAMRFAIGALVLTAIFWRTLKTLNARKIVRSALVGFLLYLSFYVQTIGLAGTTPGKNAFLTAVYCVVVPFLFWAVGNRRPPLKSFIAALLCFAGVGLVSLGEALTILPGDLLTLLCGVLFACHIVGVAVLGRDVHPVALTIVQFYAAAALCLLTGLCFETFPAAVAPEAWGSILYLGLFPTAMGILFQVIGQKYATPAAASLLLSLESVFGVLFSVLFYGEALTLRLAIGFGVIFLAVLISEWPARPARKAA